MMAPKFQENTMTATMMNTDTAGHPNTVGMSQNKSRMSMWTDVPRKQEERGSIPQPKSGAGPFASWNRVPQTCAPPNRLGEARSSTLVPARLLHHEISLRLSTVSTHYCTPGSILHCFEPTN